MKIKTTLTAEEKNKTLERAIFDPCARIHCGEIDCEECPLQDVAIALRKAQENFENAINKIEIEG